MLNLRRSICIVLSVTVLLALTDGALAADDAKSLLQAGVSDYDAQNYKAAKAKLGKINPADLTEASRRTLSSYLGDVATAVAGQTAAQNALKAADVDLKAGKFAEAKAGFKLAAESKFLRPQQKKDAKAQLALAEGKEQEAIKLAAQPKPEPKVEPKPEPKVEPKPNGEADRLTNLAKQRIAEAEALVVVGNRQLAQRAFGGAKISFEAALAKDPTNRAAIDGRAKAVAEIDRKERTGIIDKVREDLSVRKQLAELKFDEYMAESLKMLGMATSKVDYENAANAANMAAAVVERDKTLFTDAERDAKKKLVDSRLDKIARDLAAWQKVDTVIRGNELIEAERIRLQQVKADKKRKVATLTEQARTLIDDHKFDLAYENVMQILAIAPQNGWALGQRDTLSNFIILMKDRSIVNTIMTEEQKTMVDLRESEIPWYELMRYPEDWATITRTRKPYAVGTEPETEADRAVRLRFRQKMPKLEFAGVPFESVVQFLREVSGISIHVNWRALETAGVTKTTEVNVHLVDVTFERALRVILEDVSGSSVGTDQQIDFVLDGGIVTITTKEALSHNTYIRVYDIRDLIVPMPEVAIPERIGLSETSSSSSSSGSSNRGGGNRGGGGGGGLFGGGGGTGTDGDTVVQTQEELVQSVVNLVRETIAPMTWDSGSGAAIRPLGGQLVVTQTAEKHEALLDLINQLREARTMQIAVETRFLSVSTGFLNAIGLDLDLYFNLYSTVGGGGTYEDFATGAPVPIRYDSTWTQAGWKSAAARSLSPVGVRQNTGFAGADNLGEGISRTFGAEPGMQISGTFLDDIQVDFLLTATQASSQTRTLNAPRITLLNGTAASIFVGKERAYIASSESDSETDDNGNVTTTTTYTTDYFQTGTSLYVRGTISADRRYVTMTIIPTLQSLEELRWFPFDPLFLIAQGYIYTGSFVQLPDISVKTLTTVVSVPDGGTLLLGGLKETGEYEREQGVPLLSKIPFINRLVTNRGLARDESTLLILVKPKIIIQREEEEKRF